MNVHNACNGRMSSSVNETNSGILVVSNMALLPAMGFSLSRGWMWTFFVVSTSMLTSLMYHSCNEMRFHMVDVISASIMLTYCVYLLLMHCSMGWGCIAVIAFAIAVAWFFVPSSIEYEDPEFCKAHALWHLYGGVAVLALLIGCV